jgi:hypothetical protein
MGVLLIDGIDHRLCLRSDQAASNRELESVWDRRGKGVDFRIADRSAITPQASLLSGP